jgi:hypothetical protein
LSAFSDPSLIEYFQTGLSYQLCAQARVNYKYFYHIPINKGEQECVHSNKTSSATTTPTSQIQFVPVDKFSEVKTEGDIPSKIFITANEYLISRLGSVYVEENIKLIPVQFQNQSNNPSYRIMYADMRLTALQGNTVTYDIDIKPDNSIDQKWMPINNDIPDCVKNPQLCKIGIDEEGAVAKARALQVFTHVPQPHIHAGSSCHPSSSGRQGWYWLFSSFSEPKKIEINVSSAVTETCAISIGDL